LKKKGTNRGRACDDPESPLTEIWKETLAKGDTFGGGWAGIEKSCKGDGATISEN